MNTESVNVFFQDFTDRRVILSFQTVVCDNLWARVDSLSGPEPGTMFDSNLYNRIIDIGRPAQDPKPVCYELDEQLFFK